MPLWGHNPSVLRTAEASKSSPANLFCFQRSSCLLERDGRLEGKSSLLANSDPHPDALLAARFVARSFSALQEISVALGLPVTAPTTVPGICAHSLISAIG